MRKMFLLWRLWVVQLWKKEHEVFTAFLEFSRKNKLYLITWVHLAPLTLLVELLQKNEPEKSFLNNISPQFSFSDADLISWTATTPQRKCKTEAPEEQKKNSKRVTKEKLFPFLLSTNETSRRRINFFSKIVTTQGPSYFT